MTQQTLARSVIAPLGGLLEVGAVTATGTWRLSDVSVGAYVTAHQAEVDHLLSGIHRVGAFGEVFLTVLDELGYLRDHEVTGLALLLWSGGVEGLPVDVADLEEPSTVRRMCRMAADLQLTEFLDALITAAVAAGVETGAAARKVAEVLGLAADLADGSGRCSPAGVFRTWRVARLPSLLRPGSDAPEWGKAGFRGYERGLAELLDG
ncbi:hypothetical protein SAMN06272735_3316 [Streptomyces sp. TLI_55]|uniref:hypothetical protein n=1 Tax=Streptomyces sp. TLI_55 TaxID=1938861 RepID=UPI000BD40887|nr:hypothetical protein [Streptomyces sp. TLI_55]SNX61574.1 hypothetical protein SAMN06272735_3316 [Streptomyces sp. TLI_55]